ncbi:BatA and WFA domain-containing protein [soil metagenome]
MSGLVLLAPLGLLALVAVPLIVLFHMRHFTPVERPVPTLRFWVEASPERADDSRLRLPPLSLLLILQVVAAALIGLALARPAVTDALSGLSQRTEPVHLVILLDGSTSMSAVDTRAGQSRFEEARSLAVDQLLGLREGDIATLMILGTQVQTFQSTEAGMTRDVAARLRMVPMPGGIADLNSALRLVANLNVPGIDERILVISDGALSADPSVVETIPASISYVAVGEPVSPNLAIVDVVARDSPDNPARSDLLIHVANFSEIRQSTTVLVVSDGFEVARQDIVIEANGATYLDVTTLPEGASEVVVEVRSNDPFFADNQAMIRIERERSFGQRVLLVSDAFSHLQRAFKALPGTSVVTISSAEHLRAEIPPGPYDLVVFEGTTPTAGGAHNLPTLFANPPRDGLLTTSGMITVPVVDRVKAEDAILRGVDLTGVTFRETPVHVLDAGSEEIAGSQEGPLIYRGTAPGTEQPMIVMAFDLNQSNLPNRIAFPILIANIVSELTPNTLPPVVSLGDSVGFMPSGSTRLVTVTNPREEVVELPVASSADEDQGIVAANARSREVTFGETGEPGTYWLSEFNESGQQTATGAFVVNAGHLRESDLRANGELPGILAGASVNGSSAQSFELLSDLWPALVALALAVLCIEWIVLAFGRRSAKRTVPSHRNEARSSEGGSS